VRCGPHKYFLQLYAASKEEIMVDDRFYVVGDRDAWVVEFEDGGYGPCPNRHKAIAFAIDAAQELGQQGEFAYVCVLDDHGRLRSKWKYNRDVPSAGVRPCLWSINCR
jgi:hypothetical protein